MASSRSPQGCLKVWCDSTGRAGSRGAGPTGYGKESAYDTATGPEEQGSGSAGARFVLLAAERRAANGVCSSAVSLGYSCGMRSVCVSGVVSFSIMNANWNLELPGEVPEGMRERGRMNTQGGRERVPGRETDDTYRHHAHSEPHQQDLLEVYPTLLLYFS